VNEIKNRWKKVISQIYHLPPPSLQSHNLPSHEMKVNEEVLTENGSIISDDYLPPSNDDHHSFHLISEEMVDGLMVDGGEMVDGKIDDHDQNEIPPGWLEAINDPTNSLGDDEMVDCETDKISYFTTYHLISSTTIFHHLLPSHLPCSLISCLKSLSIYHFIEKIII